MKEGIRDNFYKVSSDFKPFWQVTIFHTRLAQSMIWFVGKSGVKYGNLSKWLESTNQIMDWDLDKGEILKTYKNEFECLKTIFFMKKGIRNHFCKLIFVSFKCFQAILTSYHISHQTSPQTKSWIALRQGWNSENLKKWVWMARMPSFKTIIFHEKRHTRSFLQSFKWFKAILTSYHISHQTSSQTKSWIGT